MLQLDRTRSRHEFLDGADNPCALVTERLSLSVGIRVAGAGVSYHRPIAVERAGDVTPITDVVMIVKLAGMLAVTLAMIVGVMRR